MGNFLLTIRNKLIIICVITTDMQQMAMIEDTVHLHDSQREGAGGCKHPCETANG